MLNHIVSSRQFDRKSLESIFNLANKMPGIRDLGGGRNMSGQIMTALFYEPSTRTRMSFEAAMKYLGGQVNTTENASEFSSAAKGETLEDSIQVISGYCDVIVLRHKEKGAAARAAAVSSVPIINAGDGDGEHPTQALLDVYTILLELGRLDDLTVTMMGDLKHGRTIHSLARLMTLFKARLRFVSPASLTLPEDVRQELTQAGTKIEETADLESMIPCSDVLYVTRAQLERMSDPSQREAARSAYGVPENVYDLTDRKMIIMHPLPRVGELPPCLDKHPNSAYFRQAKNGLYVRMALLSHVLRP